MKCFKKHDKNYLIVFHSWFQDSKGWKTVIVSANNKREANALALEMMYKEQTSFYRMSFKVFPLCDCEKITLFS